MNEDPYAPPRSLLSEGKESEEVISSSRPSHSFVLRWVVSLLLVINGLVPLYVNVSNWQSLSEAAHYYSSAHPAPLALFAIFSIAAGILLFRSSKWAMVLFSARLFGSITYQLALMGALPAIPIVLGWATEGFILWYMLNG